MPASEKEPDGWSGADKFSVVLETAGLNATELSAYCRERGLFPEQVSRWRQAAQDANAKPVLTMAEQKAREAPRPGPAGDQGSQEGAAAQGEGHGGDGRLAGAAKKVGGLLLGGRGRLTSASHRRKVIELISEANVAGAGLVSAWSEIGICLRILKRWR